MARTSAPLELSASDHDELRRWQSAHGTSQQVALRCRLVLAAAAGRPDVDIAATHGVSFRAARPASTVIRPRCGADEYGR